ncbi:P-loop containing nucleoside triphosphate hydrolase protein [Lasiosphaeria hispida]|uniref:P-loop containing nucleoside triphosphate hydrolase protein n=1 Tax=Lasiosphaeria hispida TaxID=260671 RepID=A0AAJ0HN24_9PEZI|nr:P-loop containing nucleoside triphosphate hydrolase protein [Lasiosphaeria hispida]
MAANIASPEVTLLLIGPTGSGKSSFIQKVAGPVGRDINIGSGPNPCTFRCKVYKFTYNETRFAIIDTPGLEDVAATAANLKILQEIANQLKAHDANVTGAIYFHRITDKRFTGTSRFNFDIFKAICGEAFFPRMVCVTTMWNNIKPRRMPDFESLSKELRQGPMDFAGKSVKIFDLNGSDPDVYFEVLSYFAQFPRGNHRPLQLEKEVRGNPRLKSVKKTMAGREVMKNVNAGFCVIL